MLDRSTEIPVLQLKKRADIIKVLYETIVVKYLCSVLFWSPHLKKAAVKLDNIQKRTSMVKGLKQPSYKE